MLALKIVFRNDNGSEGDDAGSDDDDDDDEDEDADEEEEEEEEHDEQLFLSERRFCFRDIAL